jgi:hypothetical protein
MVELGGLEPLHHVPETGTPYRLVNYLTSGWVEFREPGEL